MYRKLTQNSCKIIYNRNMVCYRYIIINILHIGDKYNEDDDDDDDDDNISPSRELLGLLTD